MGCKYTASPAYAWYSTLSLDEAEVTSAAVSWLPSVVISLALGMEDSTLSAPAGGTRLIIADTGSEDLLSSPLSASFPLC
jgi:hypothetical protein